MPTVTLYRGCAEHDATNLLKTSNPASFQASGNGEFGTGCYFWLDDLPAAILSAVQYHSRAAAWNPTGRWAVIKIAIDQAVLSQALQPPTGFGAKSIEFTHNRTPVFGGDRKLASTFVVPWDHSHVPKPNESATQAATRVTTAGPPQFGTYGVMDAPTFRGLNAEPQDHGLQGEKNKLAWQYSMIIGQCAADYTDTKLVQVKVANDGLTLVNDTARAARSLALKGNKIERNRKSVDAWKMAQRSQIYTQYFAGKADVDIDATF